jgi:hypothetical protein
MQVLTKYQALVQSAIERFCDSARPFERLEACIELKAMQADLAKAMAVRERNEHILQTIRTRAEKQPASGDKASDSAEASELAALETEVKALRNHVDQLEQHLKPTGDQQENQRRISEYLEASAQLREKDNEWFERRLRRDREALEAVLSRSRRVLRAMGQSSLLVAATVIGQELPDGMSVWSYRLYRLRFHALSFWDDLRSNRQTQVSLVVKMVEAALNLSAAALSTMVQIILALPDGVRTTDDVGAVLSQRDNVRQVLETLELQNTHLEPLLSASDLNP